jgi:predicted acyltransferase
MPKDIAAPPAHVEKQRLMSLDALRGFDMLWITGGDSLVFAAFAICGLETPKWLREQFDHVEWNGFRFEDLIFPLFLFLAGVAIPFSIGKRIEQGEKRQRVLWHVVRRTLLLVFLGTVYNGLLKLNFQFSEFFFGLFRLKFDPSKLDFSHVRFASVLSRIGLGFGFAATICVFAKTWGRIVALVLLLVGYWVAMMFMPVPGRGAGDLQQGNNLADFFDQKLLPGKLYKGNHDPEGPFSTIPAVASCLLGVLAGEWLRRPLPGGHVKAAGLFAAGGLALVLGWLWGLHFPINKNLWTSSFVLWAGGWSLLLLALFYLIIDVWKLRGWAFVFVVIGMNSITIYLAGQFIDFDAVAALLFRHAPLHAAVRNTGCMALLVQWLLLYVLYRNKLFFRA